ncbi:helix-turn-helix domain-containing protein [Enterobacter bugandensis]
MINKLKTSVNTKPTTAIEAICEKISPFAEPFTAARGEIFRYNASGKHYCYILHNGSVTLNRRDDGMVLNAENAPFIMGISNQYSTDHNMYFRVVDHSQLSRLTIERFNLLIENHNLWQSLCYLLIYNASRVYEHSARISRMSSYELICFQLHELIKEPERIRLNITAANYILSRTCLSRSGIMRILSQLRDENQITLHRGILLALNGLQEAI